MFTEHGSVFANYCAASEGLGCDVGVELDVERRVSDAILHLAKGAMSPSRYCFIALGGSMLCDNAR